jgi:hypothetical protein
MHARALRPRPARCGPYALAILPALLAGAACQPAFVQDSAYATALPSGARRGVPDLPLVQRVPADAPSGSITPSFGEAVLSAANARAATASTCASGFADLDALKSAACSAPAAEDASSSPAVDWDAFDVAYAAAGRRASRRAPPNDAADSDDVSEDDTDADDDTDTDAAAANAPYDPLRVPSGCAFGCIPTKPSTSSSPPLARVAAALPWGGKCFTRVDATGEDAEDELLVKPTSPDGKTSKLSGEKVPLVAKVKNRIKERGGANADAERVAAPARAYFGQSAFDGLPAIIVDYRGQKRFGRFRDEVRHVGCGVWLGKTYLTDKDEGNEKNASETETLAESLAAVGGVKLSPVVTAVIERAMPVFEPGEPPPHVLDFTLYATAGES